MPRRCCFRAAGAPLVSRDAGDGYRSSGLRRFASAHAAAVRRADDGAEDPAAAAVAAPPTRKPSALERARLKEVLPGRALHVLHKHTARGRAKVRQEDFVRLCASSREGKQKDAKLIATALREFKRNNDFVLQTTGARAALEGMLRSMIPTWKVQDGRPKVRAATFVAQQILDERTGLYFAVEPAMVDRVLIQLHDGLVEMAKHGFDLDVRDGDVAEAGDEGEEGEDGVDDAEDAAVEGGGGSGGEPLAREALAAAEGLTGLLVRRKTRPERDLKKRARRQYLKLLQVGSGPTRGTLSLAARIATMLGGGDRARETILAPYEGAKWCQGPGHEKRVAHVRQLIATVEKAKTVAGEDTGEVARAEESEEKEEEEDSVSDSDGDSDSDSDSDSNSDSDDDGNVDKGQGEEDAAKKEGAADKAEGERQE